jgi:hypothetical protein
VSWNTNVWQIASLPAQIPEAPFAATVDGASLGTTPLLAFSHRVAGTARVPQVFVLYASGYLRMKSGADPDPALPFGQSLILGPAVVGSSSSFPAGAFFLHPQLQTVAVDSSRLDANCHGQLVIHVTAGGAGLSSASTATNRIMNLAWTIALDEPTAQEGRISVDGTFQFTEQVTPDPVRTSEFQSLRLVQLSSLFIDSAHHDANGLRYRDASGAVTVNYNPAQANSLLPSSPTALDPLTPVLDSVNTDDTAAPNGNTPSYRLTLAAATGPMSGPPTPRAYFNSNQNVNDDNLGVWLFERPSDIIPSGSTGRIAYTVQATTDPLPPP